MISLKAISLKYSEYPLNEADKPCCLSFKQVGFCNKNSFLIFGVFHTKANTINNELIRGDFHYHVIIALESTTANGVGVDEVPKVGVSESSDFISNKLLDKFIHMDTPIVYFL